MDHQLDRIENKVDKALLLLTGNGDPAKGVIVQLALLTQRAGVVRWAGSAMFAALAGTVIALLVGCISIDKSVHVSGFAHKVTVTNTSATETDADLDDVGNPTLEIPLIP